MKGTNEQAKDHVASEEAVYRALIDAAGGEPQVAEMEIQSVPKKPPATVGANRLRRKLRQIGQ
jgi:hypothetical protein